MHTFLRYLGFQLPGWTLAVMVAYGLDQWTALPRGLLGLGLGLYVAKDFAIYPFVKSAYEHTQHDPARDMLGLTGEVVVALSPDGWVQVGSERWRARASDGQPMLSPGERVRICGLRGHVLLVRGLAEGD